MDNDNEQAAYRFDESVRPLLKSPVEPDIVKSAQEAEEHLKANDYPLAIVESILQKKPLDLDNLAGMELEELACPAANVIPSFVRVRPKIKIIVVSHSRGGMSKQEKERLAALPNVLGVFGWLNTSANAKAVAELMARHLLSV